MLSARLFGVAALAMLAPTAPSPAQQLVANLHPTRTHVKFPGAAHGFFPQGNTALFTVDTPWGGGVFETDGTPQGTRLVDIAAQIGSGLIPLGAGWVHIRSEAGIGFEIWYTEGPRSTLRLIGDLVPGAYSSAPRDLTLVGQEVFFTSQVLNQLWATDGTPAGTRRVADVPNILAASGNRLFLTGNDGSMWVSDGTTAGTVQVFDRTAGFQSIRNAVGFAGGILFEADMGAGHRPMYSDGTPAGTVLLGTMIGARGFAEIPGNRAAFVAHRNGIGSQIWITDGTAIGTTPYTSLFPGAPAGVTALVVSRGELWFVVGADIWRANPTTGVIQQLTHWPAGGEPYITAIATVDDELWFTGQTRSMATSGLFAVDGAGNQRLVAWDPQRGIEEPTSITEFGDGALCFFDRNPGYVGGAHPDGVVLWAKPLLGSSEPSDLVPFGSRLIFNARPVHLGREPVVTDGTSAGTTVLDLAPGPAWSDPERATTVQGRAVLESRPGFYPGVVATDGTLAGTVELARPAFDVLGTFGGRALFFSTDAAHGTEPWASDGTPQGTELLLDLNPGPTDSYPQSFIDTGPHGLLVVHNGTESQLWRTDGTAVGTTRLRLPLMPRLSWGTGSAGNAFFVAQDAQHGTEPWVSDGTVAGTRCLDLEPGPTSSYIGGLYSSGGKGFLFVRVAGEWLLQEIDVAGGVVRTAKSFGTSNVERRAAAAAGGLFFRSDDGSGLGSELWFSDGTPAGTQRLGDIALGAYSGVPDSTSFTPVFGGSQLAFVADDRVHGRQLWLSDGTANGTRRVSRFGTGLRGLAGVDEICSVGSDLYVAADDGFSGMELWIVPGTGGFAQAYGTGCAYGPNVPAIAAANGPPLVGSPHFAIDATSGLPGQWVFLMFGTSATSFFVGPSCWRLLGWPILTHDAAIADGSGAARFAVPLPNDPALVGHGAYFQAAFARPGGPLRGQFELSAGLQVQIGQ